MGVNAGVPTELRIESLAAGGRGLARLAGQVWFVPGAVPGDTALVEAAHARPRYVEGRLLRIVAPSPERRVPPCRYQDTCGGCPLMALPEDRQAEWRRRFVVDALERIGGIAAPPVEPLGPSAAPLAYRNRVELVLEYGAEGGPPGFGLHARDDRDRIVDIDRCLLQDDAANRVLGTLRARLLDRQAWSGAAAGSYRVLIRRSEATGEMLVGVREVGPRLAAADDLARALVEAHPEVVGVVRIRARAGGRGGATSEVVCGRGWIEERVAGLAFPLPVTTFLQVSARGADTLADLVAELAGPGGSELLDLYCGVGVHALTLTLRGIVKRAIGVDADPRAIDCGNEVARRERLPVRLERADVGHYLARESTRPDVVVANPPRTGMGRDVAVALRRLEPARIVVVSCEAATLARDLAVLLEGGRYRLARVVPVDLFPQTAHVETVSLLVRT